MKRFCLAILNLFSVPGIGTYLSGNKKIGILQTLFSISFFLMTLIPIWLCLHSLHQKGLDATAMQEAVQLTNEALRIALEKGNLYDVEVLELLIQANEMIPFGKYEQILTLIMVCGFSFFTINWIWSAFTTKTPS